MDKKNWIAKIATGAAAASLLTGCEDPQHQTDLVNIQNPNATAVSTMTIEWPKEICSTPEKIIDLTDPKQVAKALGIKLDGKPDQLLYTIKLGNGDYQNMTPTTYPVMVSNVVEGAEFINRLANLLVSPRIKAAAPEKFKGTSGPAERTP